MINQLKWVGCSLLTVLCLNAGAVSGQERIDVKSKPSVNLDRLKLAAQSDNRTVRLDSLILNKSVCDTLTFILRSKPPDSRSVFYKHGKQIGSVGSNEELIIKELKEVKYFFSRQNWIQITRTDTTLPAGEGKTGWIYVGEEKKRKKKE